MTQALAIAGIAIFIIVALVIGIQLYAYGWIWLDSMRTRSALAKQGRTIDLREAGEKIRQKEGMIIVDAPTLGWNVSRVWWSPVVDFIPRPTSSRGDCPCPREDFLNYQKFIDPSKGVARLVTGFVVTQRVEKFLRRHFGTSACGFVFSGGVLAEEHMKARLAKPGASPNGGPAPPQ